jgi:hypothetical protein
MDSATVHNLTPYLMTAVILFPFKARIYQVYMWNRQGEKAAGGLKSTLYGDHVDGSR